MRRCTAEEDDDADDEEDHNGNDLDGCEPKLYFAVILDGDEIQQYADFKNMSAVLIVGTVKRLFLTEDYNCYPNRRVDFCRPIFYYNSGSGGFSGRDHRICKPKDH